jgi:type III restriction enzyme
MIRFILLQVWEDNGFMASALIDNPIINSPFKEPTRHFRFNDEGITDEIVPARRISEHLVPIPKPRNRGNQQGLFVEEQSKESLEPNEFINKLRNEVRAWRLSGYVRVTNTTRRLLEYWTDPRRERRLYFCQIEAIETAIYLAEVVQASDTGKIFEHLKTQNQLANQDLFRIAFKMATGSGKTLIMAMLIAWHTLNKTANPQDERFSDGFLVVTPGITIRDRLRVLQPNDPENYYKLHDLVPPQMMGQLQRATLVITNFHAFIRRETVSAGRLTKEILSQDGNKDAFLETNDQMVRRVCRALGNRKNIIVINDEAHHCYRHKAEDGAETLKGEERQEAEKREEQARIWINGLEAVKAKMGVRVVFDLSATPFFLKGSGYPEGTLFGWVVSDFSLTDAIESGIVKVPRVPVADDAMNMGMPMYREIWPRIRDDLPKKGRKTEAVDEEPKLPSVLEGAITSLYLNYKTLYEAWEADEDAIHRGSTPPVFIVVCNNTNVSRLVYNYIGGWRKVLPDGSIRQVPGKLPLFSNVVDDRQLARPRTILVDSEQLESGENLSAEFKAIAADEIDQFANASLAETPTN